MPHTGPRSQKQPVQNGHQAGIEANREGKQKHREEGGARVSAHDSGGVGAVLPDGLEPWPDPDSARVFASARQIAHRASRRERGRGNWNPAGFDLALFHLAVKLQFGTDVSVHLPLSNDVLKTAKPHPRHCSQASSTLWIARIRRSNSSRSLASRFRPRVVSV